jgi:hypothetical protein
MSPMATTPVTAGQTRRHGGDAMADSAATCNGSPTNSPHPTATQHPKPAGRPRQACPRAGVGCQKSASSCDLAICVRTWAVWRETEHVQERWPII